MKLGRLAMILVMLTMLAAAYVGPTSLPHLTHESNLIIVGRVTKISKSGRHRYAEASILETWKGPTVKKVVFLASPTWTCDISDASLNEEALLFLVKGDDQGYAIAHSGRGRMPIRTLKGSRYVTLWNDVRLDSTVELLPGPDPKHEFIRSARLDDLRKQVNQMELRTATRTLAL